MIHDDTLSVLLLKAALLIAHVCADLIWSILKLIQFARYTCAVSGPVVSIIC
jgi:hypothetical protein